MSRSVPTRRTAVLLTGVLAGALALAGCGAGQVAQTAYQVNATSGGTGTVGPIEVLDAQITFGEEVEGSAVYPRGGQAPLQMRIVNVDGPPDRLVSITTPIAASVELTGDTEALPGIPLVIAGEPEPTGAAAPTGAAQATGAVPTGDAPLGTTPAPGVPPVTTAAAPSSAPATSAPAPSAPATAQPAPGAAPATLLPATPAPASPQREAQAVLTGLREDVSAGISYEMVLTFERAGTLRLAVPVGNTSEPREEAEGGE